MSKRMNPQEQQTARPASLVRLAEPADAAAISALLQESFAEYEARYTPAAFGATVLPPRRILARMDEGPVWVVETAGGVIGTVGARHGTGVVLIRGMAVHPVARGQGTGRILLDEAERFAVQKSARLVELYTAPFLDRAVRLYHAAGFEFTGEKASPHGTELLRMTKLMMVPVA